MKSIGIITEHNPFHNGHKYQIEEAKRKTGADFVVSVMSGSFVQRGGVAVCSKWARAKMAILGGVDLVIELPVVFCGQSAEYFAKGGVEILEALGIIDYISFGVENDNIDDMTKIANMLNCEPQAYKAELSNALKEGISFPSARAAALKKFGLNEFIGTSNNILAIEYIRTLQKVSSNIKPVPIIRSGAMHDKIGNCNITSASHIRDLILKGEGIEQYVPQFVCDILNEEVKNGTAPTHINTIEKAIIAKIRTTPTSDLKKIKDVSEGLENRIKQAALSCTTLDEMLMLIKTKRYTLSRIRRIISNILLGITKETTALSPQYIRVLGMNHKGRLMLKQIKEKCALPIIIKTANVESCDMLELDFTSTDIYSLTYNNKSKNIGGYDKLTSPIIL